MMASKQLRRSSTGLSVAAPSIYLVKEVSRYSMFLRESDTSGDREADVGNELSRGAYGVPNYVYTRLRPHMLLILILLRQVARDCSRASCFPKVLAKNTKAYLHMVPDDRWARLMN
ncbi:hypothetical protein E2C01_037513 [Portunus trituberculatus]|uniref:Uncharacterized protein n=1 Tax=Portunus trituberculatus TaxID=210409 RepID=A0A5B7FF52_PORTR|nr:hypothetical protein [Portunus trituberculatus]